MDSHLDPGSDGQHTGFVHPIEDRLAGPPCLHAPEVKVLVYEGAPLTCALDYQVGTGLGGLDRQLQVTRGPGGARVLDPTRVVRGSRCHRNLRQDDEAQNQSDRHEVLLPAVGGPGMASEMYTHPSILPLRMVPILDACHPTVKCRIASWRHHDTARPPGPWRRRRHRRTALRGAPHRGRSQSGRGGADGVVSSVSPPPLTTNALLQHEHNVPRVCQQLDVR